MNSSQIFAKLQWLELNLLHCGGTVHTSGMSGWSLSTDDCTCVWEASSACLLPLSQLQGVPVNAPCVTGSLTLALLIYCKQRAGGAGREQAWWYCCGCGGSAESAETDCLTTVWTLRWFFNQLRLFHSNLSFHASWNTWRTWNLFQES